MPSKELTFFWITPLPKLTVLPVEVNPEPVMVTVVPMGPEVGCKEEMVGIGNLIGVIDGEGGGSGGGGVGVKGAVLELKVIA